MKKAATTRRAATVKRPAAAKKATTRRAATTKKTTRKPRRQYEVMDALEMNQLANELPVQTTETEEVVTFLIPETDDADFE